MITITLNDDDIQQLSVILIDHDAQGALTFITERIMSEIKRKEGNKMKSHLDGGKGSLF